MKIFSFLPNKFNIANQVKVIANSAGYKYRNFRLESDLFESLHENFENELTLILLDQEHVRIGEVIAEKFQRCIGIVIVDRETKGTLKQIVNINFFHSFIAIQDGKLEPRDILTLLNRFNSTHTHGVEKYLAFGAHIQEFKILNNRDKRNTIEMLADRIMLLSRKANDFTMAQYANITCELMDELLLNAIFNANPRLIQNNRTLPFELDADEAIYVSWGYDYDFFGLSVLDPFGRLEKKTVMQKLVGIDTTPIVKRKSAGLGFKIIWERSHQVIIDVDKGHATEIVCLLKFKKRFKDFKKTLRSFHYYADLDLESVDEIGVTA